MLVIIRTHIVVLFIIKWCGFLGFDLKMFLGDVIFQIWQRFEVPKTEVAFDKDSIVHVQQVLVAVNKLDVVNFEIRVDFLN